MTDNLGLTFIAIIATLAMFFFLYVTIRLERLLDRYRLKYGFDKDIELKEMTGEDKEQKLARRERRFKRRVFKD